MKPEMCMICNDVRRFKVKLMEAERILRNLNMYVNNNIRIEDRTLWTQLSRDRQHVHFMCGRCPRVDESKLKSVEERITKNVYHICKDLEAGQEYPVRDILRLLQGNYPIMYRCIEKRVRRKSK